MASSRLGRGINLETEIEEDVTIGDIERRGGLYVLGRARTGKSTLLINLILKDIDHGHGLCFLDPHGDAIQDILKRLPSHRKDDVISLDPLDDTHAFGLNLFQCDDPKNKKQISRTLDYVLQVFAKLFTKSGDLNQEAPYMYETLLNTTILLIYNQGYTLAEVPLILTNEDAAAKLIPNIAPTHDDVRLWWERYNSMKQVDKDQITGSTRRRLQAFLTDELIRHIVGQARSTLNFRQITDERKILLVKLSREFEEVTTLVGSIIIGHLLTTAYSRDNRLDTETDRPHFCIYADEFQHFATPDFAKLFTETGKFHFAPTVAHQERVGQFEQHDKNRGATKAAANIVVFRTTVDDASEFAPEFAKKPPAETRREEKLIPVSDLIYRIVPDAPTREQMKRSPKRYPNTRVNEFIEQLIERLVHCGGSIEFTSSYSKQKEYCLRIPDYDAMIFTESFNTFLYELMRDQNPYKELPVKLFEVMVRALTPACFDKDGFDRWVLEVHELPPEQIVKQRGRYSTSELVTFPPSLEKRRHTPPLHTLAPHDYCSYLFLDGVGSYRLSTEWHSGLEGADLDRFFDERRIQVPQEIKQTYRSLWLATDEKQLSLAFENYERLIRKAVDKLLKEELMCWFSEKFAFRINDPLGMGGLPHFPLPADNVKIPHMGGMLDQLVLTWINQHGKGFTWRYEDRSDYYPDENGQAVFHANRFWLLAEEEIQRFVTRLVAELDLKPETDRIITEQKVSFEAFIREVRDVFRSLALEPVAESSGVYEEKPGTQRTFSDMVNEMAMELPNLPRFTAYCKIVKEIVGKQHILKYKLSPDSLSAVDAAQLRLATAQTQAIRERTHKLSCTERVKVEEEIIARRTELLKPVKKERKARTGEESYILAKRLAGLSDAQKRKLESIRIALGKDYERFITDLSVLHNDNLERLLDKNITAKDIKEHLERWRAAGSPASVSPFAELIKTLLG